jgi:hypothetical protein
MAAGCATRDKDECGTADWYAIGLEDGARSKKALTDGIANPRSRAAELDRLEALTREAQQVETPIQQFR